MTWTSVNQDGSSYGLYGQRFCPPLTSVTIDVNGTTTICPTSTGGTAAVDDVGGGARGHQWGYRLTSGSATIFPIVGQTAATYQINGANFMGAGTYYLVCITAPECGSGLGVTISNEVVVTVTADTMAPVVTPPSALTTTQTLCM